MNFYSLICFFIISHFPLFDKITPTDCVVLLFFFLLENTISLELSFQRVFFSYSSIHFKLFFFFFFSQSKLNFPLEFRYQLQPNHKHFKNMKPNQIKSMLQLSLSLSISQSSTFIFLVHILIIYMNFNLFASLLYHTILCVTSAVIYLYLLLIMKLIEGGTNEIGIQR